MEIEATDDQRQLAKKLWEDHGRLRIKRNNWESHWEEIARRLIPGHVNTFLSQGYRAEALGQRNTENFVDTTGSLALSRFVAIVDSLLTPANSFWAKIVAYDKGLMNNRLARLWFEHLTERIFDLMYGNGSNFIGQNHMVYESLGAYGSGLLYSEAQASGSGISMQCRHLGECWLGESAQGTVDMVFRYFAMTARQAMQVKRWRGRLPDAITKAAESDWSKLFYFLHVTCPRQDYDPNAITVKRLPWAMFEAAEEGHTFLGEGGYYSFPYAVSRFKLSPQEVYGRSPAMEALPSLKTLNEQKKSVLIQGQRVTEPVILAFDDDAANEIDLTPGSINRGGVSADGRLLYQVLPTGNLAVGEKMMEMEQGVVNAHFLTDVLQILVNTPQMSATEVLERTREKATLLAPTVGRQQGEYLAPLVQRVVELALALGLVEPAPRIVAQAGAQYRLEYVSPLARARRAEYAAGAQRAIQAASEMAQATGDPAPLDNFDTDRIVREVADISGMPIEWLADEETVAQKRADRAQQAEETQAMQAGPPAAAVMKAAAVAQGGGNPRAPKS